MNNLMSKAKMALFGLLLASTALAQTEINSGDLKSCSPNVRMEYTQLMSKLNRQDSEMLAAVISAGIKAKAMKNRDSSLGSVGEKQATDIFCENVGLFSHVLADQIGL